LNSGGVEAVPDPNVTQIHALLNHINLKGYVDTELFNELIAVLSLTNDEMAECEGIETDAKEKGQLTTTQAGKLVSYRRREKILAILRRNHEIEEAAENGDRLLCHSCLRLHRYGSSCSNCAAALTVTSEGDLKLLVTGVRAAEVRDVTEYLSRSLTAISSSKSTNPVVPTQMERSTMKPKAFIGSSREALEFANAIHTALTREVECTVWDVSFPIGGSTLSTLMKTVRSMDFGIFVFAPDDATEIRGQRYLVARDNVLYELGLFTGHLEPERCFFVLPDTIRVHIPSDLEGVTHGAYEAGRSDGNSSAAVAPFCAQVKKRIKDLGIAPASLPVALHELAVKFECADWVDARDARVRQKRAIVNEMISVLRHRPAEKRRFLASDRLGFKVLLGAAIQAAPTNGDVELILAISAPNVPRGVAQQTMVDAIEQLALGNLIPPQQRARLAGWLDQFRDVDPSQRDRIAQLRMQLS
jgi:predicted nucleotide-binding protein